MRPLSWESVFDQLRPLGIEALEAVQQNGDSTSKVDGQSPASETEIAEGTPRQRQTRNANKLTALTTILAAARRAGVQFMETVSDGRLVAEGLDRLALNDRQWLEANWDAAHSELLPEGNSTTSLELLTKLNVELIYVDTEERAATEVQRLCKSATALGLDVETAPRPAFLPVMWPIAITKDGRRSKMQPSMDTSAALDPFRAEVRLLQVAAEIEGRMLALVIDLRQVPRGSPALAPLWRCRLVGHNLSFDLKMLVANGIQIADANLVDTILLAGLVLRGGEDPRREGSRRPSLAEAVHEALGLILPKTSQLSPWWRAKLSQEQIAYAALDAVLAFKLADALAPRIAALGNDGKNGDGLEHRLCAAVGPVARMELAGVSVDRAALLQLVHSWEQELGNLKAKLAGLGIINPSSPRQVEAWLRGELERLAGADTINLSSWPRTPTGNLSTAAKHLRRLADDLPTAVLLVKFSQLEQLRSNFGEKLLNHINRQTGRLHGSFQIAAAKSGRFSSSKPNMQNIPKSESMRSLFVAPPGKQLVVADYSQLELRVMAQIAGDAVMTEAYSDGRDLHAVTAAGMLGIDVDDFDKDSPPHKEARDKAKAVNFGIIYGSGPSGIKEFARDAYNIQITIQEASTVIDGFLATYQGVARWQREQDFRSSRSRTVSTQGGRVYRFDWEARGQYSRNLALNLPIQGTAAEIAIEALVRTDARLRAELPEKAQLVLQVHDEFVVEVDEDEGVVLGAKHILEQEMTAAFEALLPGAPTRGLVAAHSGPTWATARG
jgi:DNA polymerase-1